MKLWTTQLAKWRVAKQRNIPLVDTTVRTGISAFSPNWDMVTGIKIGTISEAEYTRQYQSLMREKYREHYSTWMTLCKLDEAVIACYCAAGQFCHRHLLANYLMKVCEHHQIPFELMGELQ